MPDTAPVNLDHPCPDHNARRCLLCYPPIGLWVDQGGGDLLRVDADGTRWTVCPICVGDYELTMRYQDRDQTIRLTSHHASVEAAIQRRDDMARGLVTHGAQPAAPGFPQCAICLHVSWLQAERDELPYRVRAAVTMLGGTAVCQLHMEDVDHADPNRWLIGIATRILGPHTPGRR